MDRTSSEDALEMNAAFSTPHFISLLIEHGYLQDDHGIPVLRDPIMITDENLGMLQNVLENKEYYELPVVYVAKDYADQDPLSISWLASRLKGAVHVLVEESKSACQKCTEVCNETPEEYGAVLSDNLENHISKLAEAENAKQNAEEEIDQVYQAFDEDIKSLQKKLEDI